MSLKYLFNCVKCHEAVCNGPDCSTSLDESQDSEDHPKAASICKSCSGSKKRQSSISTLFQARFIFFLITQHKNTHTQVLVKSVYICIWPVYGSFRANQEKLSGMP